MEEVQKAKTIRLEIPYAVPGGFSAPQQFAPSIDLTRTYKVEGVEESPSNGEERVEGSDSAVIVLKDYLGKNASSDVYYAYCGQKRVVVKLMDLSFAPVINAYWGRREIAERYYDEFYGFHTLLRSLQGSIVPRLGGMFVAGNLYCTVYQDGGRQLTWDERESAAVCDQIIWAVKAVHEAGVALHLQTWKWIYRGEDGNIQFVDLNNASTYANTRQSVLDAVNMREKEPMTVEQLMPNWKASALESLYYVVDREDEYVEIYGSR